MQLTQGLRRSRALYGGRTATLFGERVRSYGEMGARVARLASALRSVGVQSGDRVGILALNSDRYAEAYYAIAWAGGVSVPFNTRWAQAEIDFAAADSEPVLMLVDDHFGAQGANLAAKGLRVIAMDASCAHGFEGLIAAHAPMDDECGDAGALACIFYTGGTTGRAKGVMLSHLNLVANFLMTHAVAPFDAETRFLHTPPMFHLADAGCLFGLVGLGATHIILPGFDPATALAAIARERVTALVVVPTMIGMLCEALRTNPTEISSVRRLTYGASPISSALLKRAMAAFPNAQFVQAYGQTELSPVATVLDHADHLAGRLRSAGRAIIGVDLAIVDADRRPLPPGAVGEVAARGANVMLGYWRQPALTAATIVGGWLTTGDAGYLDEDGYLYLVDRVKDMIISGGENVYSGEVENALMQHPAVLQCAVIGVPDEQWGERVHAILYLRDDYRSDGAEVTEAEIAAHCEPLIANYKRPKSVELRATPLPLSSVGKILKSELRRPFWAEAGRQIG